MDKQKEIMADHLPLEEVMLSDIDGIPAPENWSPSEDDGAPEYPPVLIEEERGYLLVGNHRTVWHLSLQGRTITKCLVVRSAVHVKPAHSIIGNCTEEAMLFEAILRREIVPNRSRLADMLGYSRARITQLLNLLKLPREIRRKVLVTDEVSEFQLRQLLKVIDDPEKLGLGFRKILEKKLSGRQMALFANAGPAAGEDEPENAGVDPEEEPETPVKNTITELEEVFAADPPVSSHGQREPRDKNPAERAVTAAVKPEAEVSRKKASLEKEPLDMALVIAEIGNLRSTSWRAKASEYDLPPLQMDFLEGVSKLRTGLYAKASDILGDVVSEDSSHHLAWFYLGRCANLTGALQEAEEYLRNSVSRSPENPDYLVELAIVLEKLKRHTEAEAFYRKSAVLRKKRASSK